MSAKGPEQALNTLIWPRRLTLAGLWAERLCRAFWPLWTVLLLAFAGAAFGLHEVGPLLWTRIGLGLLAFATLLTLIWGLWSFRRPSMVEALARLDASLPGRPIAALRDTQGIGADDPASAAVWRVHLARMAEKLRGAKAVAPDLQLSARDPYALRYVALTAAVMAALFGSVWRATEVAGIAPGAASAMPIGPAWEAWARPPAYTGKPTLYLNDIAAGEIELPVGSRIQIRIYGDAGAMDVVQSVAKVAPPPPEGEAAKAAVPQGLAGLTDLVLSQSGSLEISGAGGRVWQVIATPDAAPVIALKGEMGREADGHFKQGFTAEDDYGVTGGKVTISLDLAKVDRRHGLKIDPEAIEPLVLDLPMPIKGNRTKIEQTLVDDVSTSVLANLPVSMQFSASDAARNEGSAAPYAVTLPGRRFFDPMAAAVVEMRRDILWNRANTPDAVQILKAVIARPDEISRSQNAVKRLRVFLRQMDAMASPLSTAQRDQVADELWQIAFMFEEGDLGSAYDRLQRAQDRLEEAIKNGASPEEIDQLMKEMQQAMKDYTKELGKQAQNNPGQQGQQGESREITSDQLQQMLDEIQRLMKEGKTAEAMALMEELRQLMENLQVQQGQGAGEGEGNGSGAMGELGDTLKDQQGLSDDAYRNMQRGRNGQGDPSQSELGQDNPGQPDPNPSDPNQGEGQGQGAEQRPDGTSPGDLADRQRALRDRLQELQNGKLPGDDSEKGEQGRENIGRAEQAMREAEEALEDGDLGRALDKQAEAMQAMRDGMKDLGEALADKERLPGEDNGSNDPRDAARVDPNGKDPLGREPGDSARIGSDRNMVQNDPDKRAQQLLDEIRRRSGEAERPEAELDYLKRLLEWF